MLAALLSPAVAPLAAQDLAPFSARYEVLIEGKSQGSSELTFVQTAPQRWRLSLEANSTAGMARLAGLRSRQHSDFAEADGQLRLLRSEVRNGTRLGTREVVTEFDWARRQARFSGDVDRDRRGPLPLTASAATRESLNLLLALSASAARPGQMLRFDLLDRGRERASEWTVLAAEAVSVPAGRFDATVVRERRGDRDTTAWFSPDLPPLPLRVLRTIDGEARYELRLQSWRTPPG